MSLGPLYVLRGEVSVHVRCPFFNWVVFLPGVQLCECFMYFGDKPLSQVSFKNIFSHTIGSLFILLIFSLAGQEVFILMKSYFFILSFLSLTPGDISMKILLYRISEIFLPMLSSRTFMVL